MIISAIDIGTNSVLLTIAKLNKKFTPLIEKKETTKLGEKINQTNLISKNAIERTIKAVKKFVELSCQNKAEKIILLGTYALREAENKDEFSILLKEKFGQRLFVLSGKDEGKYSLEGAVLGLKNLKSNIFLIDIGGGSTELVWFLKGKIRKIESLKIGALTLTEKFSCSGNFKEDSWEKMSDFVRKKLVRIEIRAEDYSLIGTGGTITTLSAVNLGLTKYDATLVHSSKLSLSQVKNILNRLLKMSLSERRKFLKVDPKRAEIIVAGTVILCEFLRIFEQNEIIVSNGGLRWGAIKNWEDFS